MMLVVCRPSWTPQCTCAQGGTASGARPRGQGPSQGQPGGWTWRPPGCRSRMCSCGRSSAASRGAEASVTPHPGQGAPFAATRAQCSSQVSAAAASKRASCHAEGGVCSHLGQCSGQPLPVLPAGRSLPGQGAAAAWLLLPVLPLACSRGQADPLSARRYSGYGCSSAAPALCATEAQACPVRLLLLAPGAARLTGPVERL